MEQMQHIAGWMSCGSSMIYSPRQSARDVFGPDTGDTRAALTMYLFRRFGYPIHGWDSHKEVISYYLTTADPDVLLWCSPSSSMSMSMGFGLSAQFNSTAEQRERQARGFNWEKTRTYQRIDTAIRAAMTELLRPVFIRDVLYNALGRVRDNNALDAAEYSPQAGYGLGDFNPAKEYA